MNRRPAEKLVTERLPKLAMVPPWTVKVSIGTVAVPMLCPVISSVPPVRLMIALL